MRKSPPPGNRRFHLISLGCPKNRVDSEGILSIMDEAGYEHSSEPAEAGTIIVNTCAFIEAATQESIDTILDYSALNPQAYFVVAGCLPLRYQDQLIDPLPEVDLFIRPEQLHELPRLLARNHHTLPPASGRENEGQSGRAGSPVAQQSNHPDVSGSRAARILTTPGYGYLRISEGCSRRCRYCTIPSIRGSLRSASLDELEREARWMASSGVKELVLVAQDLTAYGTDRRESGALVALLKRLQSVEGVRWIRLMYVHPNGISDELIREINESESILPYLDVPFQHVAAPVLKAMGRPWKGDPLPKLVDRLRLNIPDLVLRTTLMVGYPAEGEEEFAELRGFVESGSIDHLGVFAYSPEEGTAATDLGDPIPHEEKASRMEEILRIHSRHMDRRNKGKIGTEIDSIIEGVSDESELLLQGRTWEQAPEVDGVLYITSGDARAGEIERVRITATHEGDLFGEICTNP